MADDRSDARTYQIVVRLPSAMLEEIRAKETRMRDEVPRGITITTSDAVRSLILAGLAAEGLRVAGGAR